MLKLCMHIVWQNYMAWQCFAQYDQSIRASVQVRHSYEGTSVGCSVGLLTTNQFALQQHF